MSLESETEQREPTPELVNNRQLIVASANYWFQAARKHQKNGEMAMALCCMENAVNHLENELYSLREKLKCR